METELINFGPIGLVLFRTKSRISKYLEKVFYLHGLPPPPPPQPLQDKERSEKTTMERRLLLMIGVIKGSDLETTRRLMLLKPNTRRK